MLGNHLFNYRKEGLFSLHFFRGSSENIKIIIKNYETSKQSKMVSNLKVFLTRLTLRKEIRMLEYLKVTH